MDVIFIPYTWGYHRRCSFWDNKTACIKFYTFTYFFSIRDKIIENGTVSLSTLYFWVHYRFQEVGIALASSIALSQHSDCLKHKCFLMIKEYIWLVSIVGTEGQRREITFQWKKWNQQRFRGAWCIPELSRSNHVLKFSQWWVKVDTYQSFLFSCQLLFF